MEKWCINCESLEVALTFHKRGIQKRLCAIHGLDRSLTVGQNMTQLNCPVVGGAKNSLSCGIKCSTHGTLLETDQFIWTLLRVKNCCC